MINLKNKVKFFLNLLTGFNIVGRKKPTDQSVKSILVISLYFAGDLLFHSAVIELLKKIYPIAQIDLWTRSSSSALMNNDPRINELIVYDNIKTTDYRYDYKPDKYEFSGHINRLKEKKYSLVIDLTGKRSTALAVKAIKPAYSIGFNYDYHGFCYDKFVYTNTASQKGHLIDKYLNVIKKGLNVNENKWNEFRSQIQTKPYIYSDAESILKADRFLKENGLSDKRYVVIHLTSGWNAKELPASTFAEVIEHLFLKGIEFLFIGDKSDKLRLTEIQEELTKKNSDISLKFAGTSFKVSAEFIKRAALFIGSDSAPLHIASAYDVPAIALFGPTNPDFSAPMGKNVRIIYHRLHCSAAEDRQYCSRNGGFTCPYYECMISITSAEIINAVDELWNVPEELR